MFPSASSSQHRHRHRRHPATATPGAAGGAAGGQSFPALNGKKILTGTRVAWGTNWATTPATGVP